MGYRKGYLLLRLLSNLSPGCFQCDQSDEGVIANKRSFYQTLLNTESPKLVRAAVQGAADNPGHGEVGADG